LKSSSENLRIEYHMSIILVSSSIIQCHSVFASNLLFHSVTGRFTARTWEIIENCRPVEISLVSLIPLLRLVCLGSLFCGQKPVKMQDVSIIIYHQYHNSIMSLSVSYCIILYHQYHICIIVSHLNPRPSWNSQSILPSPVTPAPPTRPPMRSVMNSLVRCTSSYRVLSMQALRMISRPSFQVV